ncbi:hypothetical protein PWG15_07115 [Ensifer adhaerens]|uniref:hypothetical protein n=1 Tax=Ensifer adhaerens TaxID=106592 RepID=UPI0023A984D7|nr:hypothetical protein [Ensifer adhaerens]WDZ78253.1 hypothetical protein PWG15_07115 [Ensifer adhaerens]
MSLKLSFQVRIGTAVAALGKDLGKRLAKAVGSSIDTSLYADVGKPVAERRSAFSTFWGTGEVARPLRPPVYRLMESMSLHLRTEGAVRVAERFDG